MKKIEVKNLVTHSLSDTLLFINQAGVKLSERLAEYGDKNLKYREVAMPELLVDISYLPGDTVQAKVLNYLPLDNQYYFLDTVTEQLFLD